MKEIEIQEDKKILKWGSSNVITIPAYLIKSGRIDPNKKYIITMREVEEK